MAARLGFSALQASRGGETDMMTLYHMYTLSFSALQASRGGETVLRPLLALLYIKFQCSPSEPRG